MAEKENFSGCKGHVQGPRKDVQGPQDFPKTLNHVFSTILLRVQFHRGARATTRGARASSK